MNGKKPWYKRWTTWLGVFVALIIIGAFLPDPPSEVAKQEAVAQVEKEIAESKAKQAAKEAKAKADAEAEQETEKETSDKVTEEKTKQVAVTAPVQTIIKKDQIESMFTRDPEEKVFENANFITKEGTLNADYIMYVGDETIPYISAIFYGGDLANITFETELSNDEIEKLLGITFSEETRKSITRRLANVEINFDKRFADENIIRFPFELD